MSDQILAWRTVASDLGIEVVAPFEVRLTGGTTFMVAALVKLGPSMAMIVDPDWDVLAPYADALIEKYHGYSAITLDEIYDRESMIEVLRDWGWSK